MSLPFPRDSGDDKLLLHEWQDSTVLRMLIVDDPRSSKNCKHAAFMIVSLYSSSANIVIVRRRFAP
jgi:hypothetical protein